MFSRSFISLARQSSRRFSSTVKPPIKRPSWGRRAAAGAALVSVSVVGLSSVTHADDGDEKQVGPTLRSLIRAYSVYSMCAIPSLVDASPTILSTLSAVPGVKQITEAFVRVTFFDQFVGADSAEEAIPLLHSLRAQNKGVLFAYSVEVDEKEATGASHSSASADNSSNSHSNSSSADYLLPYERIVQETMHCIDVAAQFEEGIAAKAAQAPGRRTWVAVKMTALLPDAHALIALSSHITKSRKTLPNSCKEATVPFPGSPRIEDLDGILTNSTPQSSNVPLTESDVKQLKRLYADLYKICGHAQEKGVKVIVDAEYSWYQPAIDALTLALMREFNVARGISLASDQAQPLVYGTFQCYLRRTPEQLALAIEDSRKYNYALGVKLVRGAYHPFEIASHADALASRPSQSISLDAEPPVWREKRDTDRVYNECVKILLSAVRDDVARAAGSSSAAAPTETRSWLPTLRRSAPAPALAPTAISSPPSIGILFGTHNWESCGLILQELERNGLATANPHVEGGIVVPNETAERVAIGQLYGMCDDLTDWVVSRISSTAPLVIKYVPYGALEEVMPYLGRRAIENKSILGEGAAQHERRRAAQEIKKRIFG